jgi:enoyl-CoA hydratase/carnithine racemase
MRFDLYRNAYRNIAFERSDGVLLVRLHSDAGTLKFSIGADGVHAQLGMAFRDIATDVENRIVILTGTGAAFCDSFERNEIEDYARPSEFYDRMYREGKDMLMRLLDIEVPIIGAINGPALIHAELIVMSDIVLAADTAVIADLVHFNAGVVPADGVHVWWPMLLGPNRGRHFLLTGRRLSAQEALELGVVAEVLSADRLMGRAWELARQLASKPLLTLRYTRIALVQHLKRRMLDELGHGLALEFTAAAAQRRSAED